jgi:hypothetical protein
MSKTEDIDKSRAAANLVFTSLSLRLSWRRIVPALNNSSGVDSYGTLKPGDAWKNKSRLFLFSAQSVFGLHGHTAL